MARKIALWLIWISFIVYVFLAAPPVQADTFQPIQTLLSGQIPRVNPIHLSIFSLVGILLLMYACLMLADGRMQKLSATAFLLASAGSGVIGLIPYLALRQPNAEFTGQKDRWLKLFDARSTGILLTFSTLILLAFAVIWGDWSSFVAEFRTNKFIHAMTLAVCLLALLFPTLLDDDMARRGLRNARIFWAVAIVPLFGPLAYLCLRPPLLEVKAAKVRELISH